MNVLMQLIRVVRYAGKFSRTIGQEDSQSFMLT